MTTLESSSNYFIRMYKEKNGAVPWGMKDDKIVTIKDMEQQDIKNTIKKLNKEDSGKTINAWIHIFETELNNRRFNKIKKLKNNIK